MSLLDDLLHLRLLRGGGCFVRDRKGKKGQSEGTVTGFRIVLFSTNFPECHIQTNDHTASSNENSTCQR